MSPQPTQLISLAISDYAINFIVFINPLISHPFLKKF